MLNQERTFEKKETKEFTLLKNDIYQVQLIDVNMDTKQKYQSNETEEVLSFEFAILSGRDVEGKDARLRLLAKNFVPTYLYISSKKGKNWLYKVVEALIGRDLTKEEEANGITTKTLNFLIGKQCRVLLERTVSKKDPTRSYSNISNILPSEADMVPLSDEELDKIAEYKKASQNKKKEQSQTEEYHIEPMPEELRAENIPF